MSSINGVGKAGQPHVEKMKLDHYITPHTKLTQNELKTWM